jgi:hypothetical protein
VRCVGATPAATTSTPSRRAATVAVWLLAATVALYARLCLTSTPHTRLTSCDASAADAVVDTGMLRFVTTLDGEGEAHGHGQPRSPVKPLVKASGQAPLAALRQDFVTRSAAAHEEGKDSEGKRDCGMEGEVQQWRVTVTCCATPRCRARRPVR